MEVKKCPRCLRVLECKSDNIGDCECQKILIDNSTRKVINDQYDDCLCINCLKEIGMSSKSENGQMK